MSDFPLPSLKFEYDALFPYISEDTLSVHHLKHHKGYVDKLNLLLKDGSYKGLGLVDVIRSSFADENWPIFNNAAQSWNHQFFWTSLTDQYRSLDRNEALYKRILAVFGSVNDFEKAFHSAALSQFGSGWVWLVLNKENDNLEIITTSNAHTPITSKNLCPLICCDVWEHAYYLDYQSDRSQFMITFLAKLINWEFAVDNFNNDVGN